MTRLCLFGDAPAVEGGSRCRAHGGAPNKSDHPYSRDYRAERERIMEPGAICYLCGLPPTPEDPLEADHVIPLSMGGGHKGNLKPAHRSCNRNKGGSNRARGVGGVETS